MKKAKHLPAILSLAVLLGGTTLPAALAAAPPDSGSSLNSVRPPIEEPANKPKPDITVEPRQPTGVPSTGGTAVTVKTVRLTGSVPAGLDKITPLLQAAQDKQLTLGQMQQLAEQITGILRGEGYLVAYAYLPAQQIKDGELTIAVVAGQYGKIIIEGNSRLSQDRLHAFFGAQRTGAFIEQGALERALLLTSDLAGVHIKAALRPGSAPGTADLVLTVQEDRLVSGSVYSDNWGNKASGEWRLGLETQLNGSLGQGETIRLGGLLTQQDLIHNYHLDYHQALGGSGLALNLGHSRLDYQLGDSYRELGATGQATTDSAALEYPLLRSRQANLSLSLGYEHKRLEDSIDSAGTDSRKHSQAAQIGLNGNRSDGWGGGGVSQYSVTYSFGHLGIDDSDTKTIDDTYTHTAGSYRKGLVTLQRAQYLAPALSLYLQGSGQWSNKNLDSSEKLYLGGATGVRAYNQSEGGGDQGYLLSAELRWRIPARNKGTQNLSLASFVDYGSVQANKNTWSGAGDNRKSLAGAGLGLLWQPQNDLNLRLDYAWKMGSRAADSDPGTNHHIWLRGQYTF